MSPQKFSGTYTKLACSTCTFGLDTWDLEQMLYGKSCILLQLRHLCVKAPDPMHNYPFGDKGLGGSVDGGWNRCCDRRNGKFKWNLYADYRTTVVLHHWCTITVLHLRPFRAIQVHRTGDT